MKGDCRGGQYVSGYMFVGWRNDAFHVVEIGDPLVSTSKDRTYRDQPAVISFTRIARKWLIESG